MSLDGPSTSKRNKLSEKIVNDIVHGLIEFPDYIRLIIDTEQFQRLRHISQLGFCKFVYPSASYSRFEHSIGTFHLASLFIKQLKYQTQTNELDIEYESDVSSVEIKKNGESIVKINKVGPIKKENNASEKFTKEDKLSVEVIRDFSISKENTKYLKINRKKILVFTENENDDKDFDDIEINKDGSNILKMSADIILEEKCIKYDGSSETETLKVKIDDKEEVQFLKGKKLRIAFIGKRNFTHHVVFEIKKKFESIEISKSGEPIFRMTNDFKVDEEGIKYIKHDDNKELEVKIVKHVEDLKSVEVRTNNEQIAKFTKESVGNYFGEGKTITENDEFIVKMTKDEIITEKDVKCVEIAALCHDLGHGPFSHTWEHIFSTKESHKTHEELSVEIFKDLIENPSGKDGKSIKDEIGLDREMIDRIERIILGKYKKKRDSNKKFLFEIVANKRSGLDVDKFDYLCRDSIYLGWANKNKIHDIKRIMQFLRVVKDKDGEEWRLAVRDREIFHIYDIFYYRHLLHRYGYQHKTVIAIECMIKDALKQINKSDLINNVIGNDEFNKLKPQGGNFTDEELFSILHSSKFISQACDYHIWDILSKTNSDKVEQIRRRNIYKLFCRLRVEFIGDVDKEKKSSLKSELEKSLNEKLKGQFSVFVVSSVFALSSENGNPIYEIPFYKKESQNEYFLFKKYVNPPPDLMNYTHEEINVLIFTDKNIKGDKNKSDNIDGILNEEKLKFEKKQLKFCKLDY